MIVGLITTHNEADTIHLTVRGLFDAGCAQVIVVDESTDGEATLLEAELAGAQTFISEGGIGPCLRRGWVRALAIGADRVVQIDAGGSHDPADVKRLLDSDAAIVVGSRFVPGAKHTGPWWRQLGSRLYGMAWSRGKDETVADWTSGYRVFSREALEYLVGCDFYASMHGWQAEVLGHAVDAGFSVEEVPITYVAGRSSLSWKVIREAWRAWLVRP